MAGQRQPSVPQDAGKGSRLNLFLGLRFERYELDRTILDNRTGNVKVLILYIHIEYSCSISNIQRERRKGFENTSSNGCVF